MKSPFQTTDRWSQILMGLLAVGMFTLGLNSVSLAHPLPSTNPQDGDWAHGGPEIPPVQGVPATAGGGGSSPGQQWSCDPHPLSQPPNIICHPALEDRLGCDGGGTGKACDTIPQGSRDYLFLCRCSLKWCNASWF